MSIAHEAHETHGATGAVVGGPVGGAVGTASNGSARPTGIPPLRTPEEAKMWADRLNAALDRAAEIGTVEDQAETLAVLRAAGLVAPEGGYPAGGGGA